MTKEELRDKYHWLYNYMAVSKNPKYMMLFGEVMSDMMSWMVENRPEIAEKYIETLCSIKWKQYLTGDEAKAVVSDMQPKAAWDYDSWLAAMKALGLEYEREPMFNSYSLWVVMNAVHSDDGKDIARLMGMQNVDSGNEEYIRTVYRFATNKLMDEDGKYCVRRYFLED